MISCDCSCTDGDMPSVCDTRWRKARKPHRCIECDDVIKPGERYEFVSGCWNGNWDSYHTCKTCVAIREWYCPHGWLYGGLVEQIEECLGFDYRTVPDDDDGEVDE